MVLISHIWVDLHKLVLSPRIIIILIIISHPQEHPQWLTIKENNSTIWKYKLMR